MHEQQNLTNILSDIDNRVTSLSQQIASLANHLNDVEADTKSRLNSVVKQVGCLTDKLADVQPGPKGETIVDHILRLMEPLNDVEKVSLLSYLSGIVDGQRSQD